MKYMILFGRTGWRIYPIEALGGKTPLAVARTPNMDRIAGSGTLGLVDTIPAGFKPGSDVANLSVLGYDPAVCYSGRGPLEAANMGVHLGPDDVAFRCNLVTLGRKRIPSWWIITAGHITSDEAARIIMAWTKPSAHREFQFYPGISYRHLLVWRNGKDDLEMMPPHDITGRPTAGYQAKGEGADVLGPADASVTNLFKGSFGQPDAAGRREKTGHIHLALGQGRAPRMVRLTDQYQLRGGMISAVDLAERHRDLCRPGGDPRPRRHRLHRYRLCRETRAALAALKELDFMFVHVEHPMRWT